MENKIINCSRCGRFTEVKGFWHLCDVCFKQDEKDFSKIRNYLYEHPGAKMFELSVNLGIEVYKIKRYLRESRLEIIEKNNLFLHCESCGKSICSGKYCDDCFRQMSTHNYKTAYVGKSLLKTCTGIKYMPLGGRSC